MSAEHKPHSISPFETLREYVNFHGASPAVLAAIRGIEEQLEATREALRGVFVWVEVPDSSMGDSDWRKREEAMREAQRVLTHRIQL